MQNIPDRNSEPENRSDGIRKSFPENRERRVVAEEKQSAAVFRIAQPDLVT